MNQGSHVILRNEDGCAFAGKCSSSNQELRMTQGSCARNGGKLARCCRKSLCCHSARAGKCMGWSRGPRTTSKCTLHAARCNAVKLNPRSGARPKKIDVQNSEHLVDIKSQKDNLAHLANVSYSNSQPRGCHSVPVKKNPPFRCHCVHVMKNNRLA